MLEIFQYFSQVNLYSSFWQHITDQKELFTWIYFENIYFVYGISKINFNLNEKIKLIFGTLPKSFILFKISFINIFECQVYCILLYPCHLSQLNPYIRTIWVQFLMFSDQYLVSNPIITLIIFELVNIIFCVTLYYTFYRHCMII